jgi:hypothetical protein
VNYFGDEKDKEQTQTLMQRIRAMPLAEALRLARSPDPQERIALERLHGKLAWESLLRNPGLSIPEVVRIAGMGAIPFGLLDIIVANPAWLSNDQVRRTLLANRALKGQNITTILRMLSKSELELATKQTAYSSTVRETARRMMRTP